ncbi:MAG: site-specific integrase [Nitrosarchaeum sp.]|nr:site-specific integrase [Nitrosarchaeum sp.]
MSWVRIPLDPPSLLVLKYDPPHYVSLKINYDDINSRNNPYQLFLDNIKSPETERKYKKMLERFLLSIPDQIYENKKIKSDLKNMVKHFVALAKKNPDLATDIIATYIKEEKKLVEAGKLSSGTLENHIKPIKVLLDANRIAIHWKSLHRLYPRKQSTTNDRAYTKTELQKMLEVARDLTDKVIITVFSSGGFRLEAWNYFTWKDIKLFKNQDGSYKGGALLVYSNDEESYWTHITPEACKYVEMYREKWKSDIGVYPKDDQPFLKAVKYPTIHRLNSTGVKKRIGKIVKAIGMRDSLPEGKKRYEVPLDHGFRKYFNTMMRRAKVNYLDKEDMMGHKVGLEKHYERYQEEDFERFPEYQKAIAFLTISDEDRLRFENQQKQEILDEVTQKDYQIEDMSARLSEVENEVKNGRNTRWNSLFQESFRHQDNEKVQLILTLLHMWFEMRATEEEKQALWKKLQDAKKEGKPLNIMDMLDPDKDELSWKNLYSKK